MKSPLAPLFLSFLFISFATLIGSSYALAGEVEIVVAEASCHPKGRDKKTCDFSATLKHADTGWEHYANRFEILIDGAVIATRVLRHPHVDEQPFTRTLRGVELAASQRLVELRAHDSKHGTSAQRYRLELPLIGDAN